MRCRYPGSAQNEEKWHADRKLFIRTFNQIYWVKVLFFANTYRHLRVHYGHSLSNLDQMSTSLRLLPCDITRDTCPRTSYHPQGQAMQNKLLFCSDLDNVCGMPLVRNIYYVHKWACVTTTYLVTNMRDTCYTYVLRWFAMRLGIAWCAR